MENTTIHEVLGIREIKILDHLATVTGGTHKTIMAATDYDRGNLTRHLKGLEAKGLIQAIGETDGRPGRPGSVWGLTGKGLGYVMISSDYSPCKIRQAVQLYKEYVPLAAMLHEIIITLDEVVGDSDRVMGSFYKHTAMLMINNVNYPRAIKMIRASLKHDLTKGQFKVLKNKLEKKVKADIIQT